jgi:mRNA interferase RelE/StbE
LPYEVEIPKRVQKQLDALPNDEGTRLREDFEAYAADPLDPEIDVAKIVGAESQFRVRCGGYRLIFRKDKADRVLVALKAGDRKDVYR